MNDPFDPVRDAEVFAEENAVDDAAAVFDDVTKDYPTDWLGWKKLRAVDGVSFSLKKGEVLGLVGPNRSGKTTLVKILLSLCRPTMGTAQRLGFPVYRRHTLARVGYVHENQAFPRYLSAQSLLEYYGALSRLSEPAVQQRVPLLLEKVGLADRAHDFVSRFSKGMLQRISLAQALLTDPDLLIMDEPGEGLDLEGRHLLGGIVSDLRNRGKSVLLISHQISDVESWCDRLAVLVKGRLTFCGSIAQLTKDCQTEKKQTLESALMAKYGLTSQIQEVRP